MCIQVMCVSHMLQIFTVEIAQHDNENKILAVPCLSATFINFVKTLS